MAIAPQEELPHKIKEEPSLPVLATAITGTIPKKPPKSDRDLQGPSRVRNRSKAVGLCYTCGEYGRMARGCSGPENLDRVFQRLKFLLGPGNEEETEQGTPWALSNSRAATRSAIPEGLIGPQTEVPVKVNEHPCTAILDSGSQVNILFKSMYKAHFNHLPLFPLSGLSLCDLSENLYPYHRYIKIKICFPMSVVGTDKEMVTIALVCPDPGWKPEDLL